MSTAGILLLVGGTVAAITGVVLASRPPTYTNGRSYPDQDFDVDIAIYITGVGMAAAGIPLMIIGNRKIKHYNKLSRYYSINLKLNRYFNGINLTYKF